jgi:hypothetical protein
VNQPNLFSFATSELSQDAFICWLLSWANPRIVDPDEELSQVSKAFIGALFAKHRKSAPSSIKEIKITKQNKNIDVLCVINDKYVLLIEDKTGTKQHSNQLKKYLDDMKGRKNKEGNSYEILPIYYKTEDQGCYQAVNKAGYEIFLRKDILNVLVMYEGSNNILIDYRQHLMLISERVESYLKLPIKKWNWHSWIGFYIRLKKEMGVEGSGNWSYVPNPSGGFLGMWWSHQGDEKCQQHLQLEQKKIKEDDEIIKQGKLCYKIKVPNKIDRKSLRKTWYQNINNKAKESDLTLKKPTRFGNGKYMTVCIHDGEYRYTDSNGIINIEKTITLLRKAESLLKAC